MYFLPQQCLIYVSLFFLSICISIASDADTFEELLSNSFKSMSPEFDNLQNAKEQINKKVMHYHHQTLSNVSIRRNEYQYYHSYHHHRRRHHFACHIFISICILSYLSFFFVLFGCFFFLFPLLVNIPRRGDM